MSSGRPPTHLVLVLHGHLPDVVGHGVWPHGTDWLYEAAAETYIPFLRVAEGLSWEGVPLKVTVGLTPILLEQLTDPRFPAGLKRYLKRKSRAAEKDREHFVESGEGGEKLASFWSAHYQELLDDFESRFQQDLVGAFRALERSGAVQIISSAATHGFLPLLPTDEAIERQLDVGLAVHERHFGRAPRGLWLPECAYRPAGEWVSPADGRREIRSGLAGFLAKRGIEFTFVETHLLRGGVSRPAYGGPAAEAEAHRSPYRIYSQGSPLGKVSVMARDPRSSEQVWSGEVGYPGEPAYLEFHKKHFPGGHRYWAVTDSQLGLGAKRPYELSRISERVRSHAEHFLNLLEEIPPQPDGNPSVVTAMFDFELFGHWWFEGVQWLGELFRLLARRGGALVASTASEAIASFGPGDPVELEVGSWGKKGDFRVWWNDDTLDYWKRVEAGEAALARVARAAPELEAAAARQLLLLQSSDWPFLIENGAVHDYAERRILGHHQDLWHLVEIAEKPGGLSGLRGRSEEDLGFLASLAKRDRMFGPELARLYPAL